MPIADDRLQADTNAYILMQANQTIRDALIEWSKGGTRWGTPREWWWLVIENGSQKFTAIPFEQIRDLLGQGHPSVTMETRLAELPEATQHPESWHLSPGVIMGKVADKNNYNTATALQLAENSPGQLLVITEQGKCVGILSKRTRSFAMATLSLLKMLEDDEKNLFSSTPSTPQAPKDASTDKKP
jgi:hypothetical protein